MKKTLLSVAAAAVLGLASASAFAEFQDFTVNEGNVPGSGPNLVVADKLNGAYTEYLTATGPGTFSAAAIGNMGQFFANEGTGAPVPSQINNFGTAGYAMYAIFIASGNITGPNLFQGTAGQFYLYIDPDQDTKFTGFNAAKSATALPTVDAAGSADDYLIAYSLTGTGTGNLNGPPGAFNIDFTDFVLTDVAGNADGKGYFVSPDPFHMLVNINGDYDVFTGSPVGGTATVTGDVSAVFLKVPEPGSLALMGLGLAGLGFAKRRKVSK